MCDETGSVIVRDVTHPPTPSDAEDNFCRLPSSTPVVLALSLLRSLGESDSSRPARRPARRGLFDSRTRTARVWSHIRLGNTGMNMASIRWTHRLFLSDTHFDQLVIFQQKSLNSFPLWVLRCLSRQEYHSRLIESVTHESVRGGVGRL